jgi:hypothetical protein
MSSILIRQVNQIGSVTEAIDAVKLAKMEGWGVMGSHRSGETEVTKACPESPIATVQIHHNRFSAACSRASSACRQHHHSVRTAE